MDYTEKLFGLSADIVDKYNLNTTDIMLLDYLKHFCSIREGLAVIGYDNAVADLPLLYKQPRTLSRNLSKLENMGLIRLVGHNHDLVEYIKSKAKKRKSIFESAGLECEWCGDKVMILESHHYPIQRVDGGTETVNICPTCHSMYHNLRTYELNMNVIKDLKNNVE